MNTDAHKERDDADDKFVSETLASLDQNLPAGGPEIFNRITQLAGDVFAEDGSVTPADELEGTSDNKRGRHMFTKAVLALAAVAAAIALLVNLPSDVTFGSILDKAFEADSLHLKIVKDGKTADVLVKMPGQVHWSESSTKYQISAGSKLWRIDEEDNTVESTDSPWFKKGAERVDLLAMLGLDSEQAMRLRRSVSRGKKTHVFSMATGGPRSLHIEAIADRETGRLRTITCWAEEQRGGPPVAELTLVARNIAVDEAKFVVAKSLSEDGRIGKVTDSQGIVTLRPMMNRRWTPIARHMLLKPGDWVRTDVRGANASALTLTSQFKVTVGPGSLVELRGPNRLRIHGGEVKIAGGKKAEGAVELTGLGDDEVMVAAGKAAHYRVDRDGQLQEVAKKPTWLAGFEGSSTNESIGSLVTKIDGRNVSLSVGFHKVKVEIRDQIARTTIEESFVNHTGQRLEGVFHFPLPQDASISGFGMWIHGELIEADVVEKQRAREIYETILRERRDPGLLEWTGGNIFKARVFPIEAHSEKRIRIVYTQVLPLRANRYRYTYGLRSELLQKTPARELSLDVQVHSALPLKAVTCSTHPVRSQLAEHSAQLEFAAQEYTPERDFEVVCEVDSAGNDVVVVPHRRGDDGYFLVQLTPPGAAGNWQRELLPDGEPMELLLVCDTSASMDSQKRKQQADFVATLLEALSPEDRFNIAATDVDCHWLHEGTVEPTGETIEAARTWLADRVSLGWTDLDRMTESALAQSNDRTDVIYIGDGIVTAGDADPQAFVNRLKRLTDGKRSGTFHAVSVGNSFESSVLKAVAGVGGGSIRKIGGEQTPQRVAFELLNEIAQPDLRDLQVEFRGLQVAAVYPDKLPNLSAGKQQILIGRYLPQGEDQTGEIVVTGQRGDETVRYASRISLADAEEGNSFVPRLWARAHLDQLLQQGSSQEIKDDIIALSEEFHIITPYTSLLVLETDEDRERFGVKRRFRMRDGERFFAEGRDNATYELLQQQMKRAGDWRLALRRSILLDLLGLGRNSQLFQQLQQNFNRRGGAMSSSAPMSGPVDISGSVDFNARAANVFAGERAGREQAVTSLQAALQANDKLQIEDDESLEVDGAYEELDLKLAGTRIVKAKEERAAFDSDAQPSVARAFRSSLRGNYSSFQPMRGRGGGARGFGGYASMDGLYGSGGNVPTYAQWMNTLFPHVPAVPPEPSPLEPTWPEKALAISTSLLQTITVADGGLEVRQHIETFDPRWDRQTGVTDDLALYSAQRWLSLSQAVGSQTQVQWYDEDERGIYSRAFQQGRVRTSQPRDYQAFLPGHRAYAADSLHDSFRDYDVEVNDLGDDRARLTLTHKNSRPYRQQFTVDTKRRVVLASEVVNNGRVTSTTKYTDYVQVADVWWPRKIETFDAENRLTSSTTQQVKELGKRRLTERIGEELPDRDRVRLLRMPAPSLRESETAAANGSADFGHRLVLLLQAVTIQKWDEVLRQLEAMEQLDPGRPGLPWLRAAVLIDARKNEDAHQLLRDLSNQVVAGEVSDEFFLSGYLLDQTERIVAHNELLRLLDQHEPVFGRQPEYTNGPRSWSYRRTQALRGLGRTDEVVQRQRELATSGPWDVSAQTVYAQDLARAGNHDSAYVWLRQEIGREERYEYETNQLRNTYADLLQGAGKNNQYATLLKEWIDEEPADQQVYQRYLRALLFANRVDDANATAREWMQNGRVERQLEPPGLARLNAAVYYALGQRYRLYMNWLDPIWFEPLAETARFFVGHEHHFDVASRIINHYRFSDSEVSDDLRAEIALRLKNSVETLDEDHLGSIIGWVVRRDDLTEVDWEEIADALRDRWDAQEDATKRNLLGNAILQIYAVHARDTKQLPFLRERIARAEREEQPISVDSYRLALFSQLLSRDSNEDYEVEALTLVEQLAQSQLVSQRLIARITALHRFVDRMLEARYQADMKRLQDEGHPERLTRTELAGKKAEFLNAAREGVAARLAECLDRQPDSPRDAEKALGLDELLQWVRLERMYLDLRMGRNLKSVTTECWAMLGDAPIVPEVREDTGDEAEAEANNRSAIEKLRRDRAFAMVNYLAVRRSAAKPLVERLLKYFGDGVSLEGDAAMPWKQARFSLLIALDRPDELETELREWIRTDDFPAPWQLALGRLMAERGKIDEAIRLFEAVERDSQLSPHDYRALGDWYLVADQRERHRRAKVEAFKATQEYQINRWLRQQRQPWYRRDVPLPSELDENVLFAFQALFEKSNQPQNYVDDLREFYTACRDFRLLRMLPDSLTGRTPQQIYPFLKALQSKVLDEIRNEATADEILQRVADVRESSESAVDLRALDLFEAMIERQSAEVLNQPGPHIEASVAALARAFEREWVDGEVRQMANLLDSLGTIKQPMLNDERLRQLRELHRMTEPGTDDRLFVAWHLSHALFWSHDRKDEGIATMESAIREFEETHAKGWPTHANDPLGGYIDLLESANRFASGEDLLAKHIVKPLNASQEHWLIQRRNQLYLAALGVNGQVSLGSGEELYDNLESHMREQLRTADDDDHRARLINQLQSVYRIANVKKIAACKADLRACAFTHLPPALEEQVNNYEYIVSNTAELVRQVLGSRDALAFAIERYEAYPKRFNYTYQSPWRKLADRMCLWHNELNRNIGDLEPRLLAIVLDELRRDLRTRRANGRYFYTQVYKKRPMWIEKTADFHRTAEEVLAERNKSGRIAVYVAQYLHSGLGKPRRAIEILLNAHDEKILDTSQQIVLVDMLRDNKRHAEAIPILEPLVESLPDVMAYRTRLLTAYHRSQRPQQARELLTDTDAHFRMAGRWTESNIAQLASSCFENKFFAESAAYYDEVIPMHQRTAPNRGVGQHTLSGYYTTQARAYSGLGETRKAVDAAAAGVVSWERFHSQRSSAVHWLGQVIAAAKDLDDYVEYLDKQVERKGEDSPLIRQQIGIAYAQRNQHAKAVTQFRAAVDLQPTDVTTHQHLIDSYDAMGDRSGGTRQTLALLDFDRHNLDLYKKLADRLKSDKALAERAATTIVEAAPEEAEHHQSLAEIRQQQDRWVDAIEHWKQVAKLRRLEPSGLLKLAEAQIHVERFDQAQESLDRLNRTEWPARFGDIGSQVRSLQRRIPSR